MHPDCSGGGIGRHAGLKIPWTEMSVRVRFPSGAHQIPLGSYSERDFCMGLKHRDLFRVQKGAIVGENL